MTLFSVSFCHCVIHRGTIESQIHTFCQDHLVLRRAKKKVSCLLWIFTCAHTSIMPQNTKSQEEETMCREGEKCMMMESWQHGRIRDHMSMFPLIDTTLRCKLVSTYLFRIHSYNIQYLLLLYPLLYPLCTYCHVDIKQIWVRDRCSYIYGIYFIEFLKY